MEKHWVFAAAERHKLLISYLPHSLEPWGKVHLQEMLGKIKEGNQSITKANRWLGWIQACLCFGGVATLDALKEINRHSSAEFKLSVPEERIEIEQILHASAPKGMLCSECTMDQEPCPTCYHTWWAQRHPNTQLVSATDSEVFAANQRARVAEARLENLLEERKSSKITESTIKTFINLWSPGFCDKEMAIHCIRVILTTLQADAQIELEAERKAQENLAIRLVGQEEYDKSSPQIHPLVLVENAFKEMRVDVQKVYEHLMNLQPKIEQHVAKQEQPFIDTYLDLAMEILVKYLPSNLVGGRYNVNTEQNSSVLKAFKQCEKICEQIVLKLEMEHTVKSESPLKKEECILINFQKDGANQCLFAIQDLIKKQILNLDNGNISLEYLPCVHHIGCINPVTCAKQGFCENKEE
jgi:hypothetical protein